MRILKSLLSIILIIAILRTINGVSPLHFRTFINEVETLETTIYDKTMFGKALLQLKSLAGDNGFTWDDDTSVIGNIARNLKNIGGAVKFYFYTMIFATGTILVDVLIVNIALLTFVFTICGFIYPKDYDPNAPPAQSEQQEGKRPWWWFFITPKIV